ncbi:hypothetical protein ACFZBU_19340 [Embleya sp. NPDC008237]|uniref:hypothetical protein n=1 Tax=Embleya sp. NPDC008237 TaxID=3363978 RepID=UPI0036E95D16
MSSTFTITPPTRNCPPRRRPPEGAVDKHNRNLFAKLGPAPDEAGHRRVPAVLARVNS